jgi:hypothetical protein
MLIMAPAICRTTHCCPFFGNVVMQDLILYSLLSLYLNLLGGHVQERHTRYTQVQLWAHRLLDRSQLAETRDIVFILAAQHIDCYGR